MERRARRWCECRGVGNQVPLEEFWQLLDVHAAHEGRRETGPTRMWSGQCSAIEDGQCGSAPLHRLVVLSTVQRGRQRA